MRAGRVINTVNPADTDSAQLANMMVGRQVILTVDKKDHAATQEILKVEGVSARDQRDLETVHNVSFIVRGGEVLGIAGVQGNGQTELSEALTGLRSPTSGRVTIDGKDLTGKTPRVITQSGLAHIPEDRQRHGLVLSYSIIDNMALCDYYYPPFSQAGVIQPKALDENARKLIQAFDVRTPSPFVSAGKLSGGNQQKVIVARELSRAGVKLVIANQPTRGLDVGSIEYIHSEIIEMRDRGIAVLLISAELDEVMALSDRIAVMYRGQIVAVVETKNTTREQLGLWMAGAHVEAA
jgi:simple sugar transport system ATP-binding protein